jgi:heavy metal translocating P-type ATPase
MSLNIFIVAGAMFFYTGVKIYKKKSQNKKKTFSNSKSFSIKKNHKQITASHKKIGNESTQSSFSHLDQNHHEKLKKIADRNFILSSVFLGLATTGTVVYPPLMMPTLIGIIFISLPLWGKAYKSLFKENQVNVHVISSIALIGLLFTGHYFIAALDRWLFTLSEKLLLKTKDNSKKRLINIFGELPSVVWLLKEGIEFEVALDSLKSGDIVVVNAGETIPVDGIITDGMALIDQHLLTGESQPSEKGLTEQVFASTIVLSGRICIEVNNSGKQTVASKINEILRQTADNRMSIQSRGEKIANTAVLPTLAMSVLALPVSGYTGALSVLYSFIGCDTRLIMPISVLNFLKIASEKSLLIKDGRALESLTKIDTIVFDKTGTLTQEQPTVGKIYSLAPYEENELLEYATAAEYKQAHPIAKAIIEEANKRKLTLPEIDNAIYEVGYGIKVNLSNKLIRVGSVRFIENEGISIPEEIRNIILYCHEQGYSLILVAINEQVAGAIELRATIRPETKRVINDLRKRNLSIYIISGDHEKPTKQLAKELGIDNYFAETLPENKANIIEKLQKEGKNVCFIGDGINDSIALKKADVSISLRGASTIATDTAQIILMDKSLKQICELFYLAQELNTNLNRGLLTTIIPGVTIIGGAFFLHIGIINSIILSNLGLVIGVSNSMLPLIKHHELLEQKP